MDAVLRVDLKPRIAAIVVSKDLVNTCRAVALCRFRVGWKVGTNRQRRIRKLQVARLIFLVVRGREADIGQAIKAQHAIGARVLDLLMAGSWLGCFGVSFAVLQRSKRVELQDIGYPHIKAAAQKPAKWAPFAIQRSHIAHPLQVFANRPAAQLGLVRVQRIARASFGQRRDSSFSCRYAGQHRIMVALDPRQVHQPGRASKQRAAREGHLWDRLVTALGHSACAIGHTFAAL